MIEKMIKIGHGFHEPFDIFDPCQLNIALPTEKTAHALPAPALVSTAGMIVIDAGPCVSRRFQRENATANSTCSFLLAKFMVKPLLVNSVFRQRGLPQLFSFVFWTVTFAKFRIRLFIVGSIHAHLALYLYGVVLVVLTTIRRYFFVIISRPFIVSFVAAWYAPGLFSKFSIFGIKELFQWKVFEAFRAGAISRDICWCRRGHAWNCLRVGFVRRLQRLTSSLYQFGGAYVL